MKKVILTVAVVATMLLGFTSCDKDTYKCWKVNVTVGNVTVTAYFWSTENQIDALIEEEYGIDCDFTKSVASSYQTSTDCMIANI